MIAVAAVVVIAVAGGGWFMMNKDEGAVPEPLNQSLTQAAPTPAAPVTQTLPANVVLMRAIEAMPGDSTAATAREALAYLQRFDSIARLSDDSTLLQFRYLRSRAMLGTEEAASMKAGCDTLKNLEARLAASRFNRPSQYFLKNVCSN